MLHLCCLTSRYLHPLTQTPEGWRAASCSARRSSGKWPTPSNSTTSRISSGCSRGILVAARARTRQKQNSPSDSQDCPNAPRQPGATLRDESSCRQFHTGVTARACNSREVFVAISPGGMNRVVGSKIRKPRFDWPWMDWVYLRLFGSPGQGDFNG